MRHTIILIAGALLYSPAIFGTTVFTSSGNLSGSNDPFSVQASFTFGSGTIQLVLTNLITGQNDIGQDLNGISFTIPATSGSVSSFSGTDRTNITPNVAGGWTDAADSNTTRWFFTNSSNNFNLTAIGNSSAAYTIVGGPDGNNEYTANSSIDNHDPLLAVTATWNLSVPGVTAADEGNISGVKFTFGTMAGEGDPQTGTCTSGICPSSTVPEPFSFGLAGSGLLLIGLRRQFCR